MNETNKTGRKKLISILITVAAMLIAVTVGLIFLLKDNKKNSPKTADEAITELTESEKYPKKDEGIRIWGVGESEPDPAYLK